MVVVVCTPREDHGCGEDNTTLVVGSMCSRDLHLSDEKGREVSTNNAELRRRGSLPWRGREVEVGRGLT